MRLSNNTHFGVHHHVTMSAAAPRPPPPPPTARQQFDARVAELLAEFDADIARLLRPLDRKQIDQPLAGESSGADASRARAAGATEASAEAAVRRMAHRMLDAAYGFYAAFRDRDTGQLAYSVDASGGAAAAAALPRYDNEGAWIRSFSDVAALQALVRAGHPSRSSDASPLLLTKDDEPALVAQAATDYVMRHLPADVSTHLPQAVGYLLMLEDRVAAGDRDEARMSALSATTTKAALRVLERAALRGAPGPFDARDLDFVNPQAMLALARAERLLGVTLPPGLLRAASNAFLATLTKLTSSSKSKLDGFGANWNMQALAAIEPRAARPQALAVEPPEARLLARLLLAGLAPDARNQSITYQACCLDGLLAAARRGWWQVDWPLLQRIVGGWQRVQARYAGVAHGGRPYWPGEPSGFRVDVTSHVVAVLRGLVD